MAITVDPNEPFHVLLGGQVTPVSLEVLDTLYQADRIEESTLIWQQGLGAWLRLDAVLAELEKQDPPPAQQREVEPDNYYVNFGDSDVRLLSLDQLDKFYDLEVIDDATLVWQPGFAEWIPLAVLIGETDAPPVSIHPSLGPQQSSARPASMAPAFIAPAPSMAAPRPQSYAPHSSSAPAPSMGAPVPQPFGASALPRPSAPPASSRAYSLAPNSLQEVQALTLSTVPSPVKASPWFGRGLLAASLFVGLLVVQRNGVMMDLAEGAGQTQSWKQVEASVGGTSVDTPQGLAVWLSELRVRHGLGSLTPTEPIAAPEPKAAAAAEPAFKITPLPPAAPAAPSGPSLSAANSNAKAEEMAAKMRDSLVNGADRPATTSVRPVSRPAKASSKSRKKSSGADAYDPMNGTL